MANAGKMGRMERILYINLPIGMAAFLALLLLEAGSAHYWQAWAVCGSLFLSTFAVGRHFLASDPEFLAHRMKYREKEEAQKKIISSTGVFLVGILLIPALDFRWGWSAIPAWLCVASLAAFLATYWFTIWVFKANRYASRIIEVQEGQKVISTGPYAMVRHPMYAAQTLMYPFLMLALGSWWACALSVGIVIPLVLRIRNEEAVLTRDLPGYAEYRAKVPYRLFPRIW